MKKWRSDYKYLKKYARRTHQTASNATLNLEWPTSPQKSLVCSRKTKFNFDDTTEQSDKVQCFSYRKSTSFLERFILKTLLHDRQG